MSPVGHHSAHTSPVNVRVSVALSDQVARVPEPSSHAPVVGSVPSRVWTNPRLVPATGRPVVGPLKPTPDSVAVQTPDPDCSTAGRPTTDRAAVAGAVVTRGTAAATAVAVAVAARIVRFISDLLMVDGHQDGRPRRLATARRGLGVHL